jgi:hypothetical protein
MPACAEVVQHPLGLGGAHYAVFHRDGESRPGMAQSDLDECVVEGVLPARGTQSLRLDLGDLSRGDHRVEPCEEPRPPPWAGFGLRLGCRLGLRVIGHRRRVSIQSVVIKSACRDTRRCVSYSDRDAEALA